MTMRSDTSPAGAVEPFDVAIKRDHEGIKQTFDRFFNESAPVEERQRAGWQIIRDLCIHSLAEEEAVYPAFRNHLGAGARDHALDEHTTLKQLLITLDGMKLQQSDGTINQEYVQKMRETLHDLEHHIQEEEQKFVPQTIEKMSPEDIKAVSRNFSSAKLHEPTRPHTMAPDKPATGNVVMNMATATLDKLRDIVGRWGMESIPSAVIRQQ